MTVPFKVVIPARLESQRLPGKPLIEIAGRPLVVWCLERARASRADEVIVAVDDERIAEVVEAAGGRALLTSKEHASGTDRLAEVASKLGFSRDDIVVNLQGDEPLVPPELLNTLAEAIAAHPHAGIATMATPIESADLLFNENVVKVELDVSGFAMTFTRAPVPWVRGTFRMGERFDGPLPEGVPFLRHLGLYAYRTHTLRSLSSARRSTLETTESLEQLRALALGIPIHVTTLAEAPPHGVDTPSDLERVRNALAH